MGLRIREILIAIPNNRTKFSLHFRFLQALQGEHSFPLPDMILKVENMWEQIFLRMMVLYSKKVYELSKESENDELDGSLSYLNAKEKESLAFLLKKRLYEFTPIEVSKMLGVTNKTIINRCAKTNDKELFFLFHNSIIMV